MAQKDRVFQILDLIRAKQKVSVSELSAKFGVTGETIRRDLERLEREGYVARTYGGAVLIQQPPGHVNYTERAVQNVEAKIEMGELTASILPSSGAIGCDASTTVLSMIPYIKDNPGITLLTNSIRILNDFMYDKIRIISTGGNLRSRTQSLQGEAVSRSMEDYFLDVCVLSCRSLDLENGIYEGDEEEAYFKNIMVEHSRRVIIVADHTKFNKTSLIRTLPYEKVDVLVTDRKPSDEWINRLEGKNVRVLYPGISFS
ncbi:MAG: DeoR/GlpR transcriptional regulator [Lachnospiraceae bacterium]|nr:DeoR/GlpR transcriptional regulator [Lachnospiraceae bacterium]